MHSGVDASRRSLYAKIPPGPACIPFFHAAHDPKQPGGREPPPDQSPAQGRDSIHETAETLHAKSIDAISRGKVQPLFLELLQECDMSRSDWKPETKLIHEGSLR